MSEREVHLWKKHTLVSAMSEPALEEFYGSMTAAGEDDYLIVDATIDDRGARWINDVRYPNDSDLQNLTEI